MTDLKGKVAIAAPPVWGDNDAVKTIGGGGTGTAVVAGSENADWQQKYLLISNFPRQPTRKYGMYWDLTRSTQLSGQTQPLQRTRTMHLSSISIQNHLTH